MGQLSLLEQSRIELPAISDEARMVQVAARIVDDLALRPPVSLEVVASYQGVGDVRGMETVGALAKRYAASLEATAHRLIDLWPEEALLVVLEVATKPSEPKAEPRPRIRYARGRGRWPFLPRYKSASEDSLLSSTIRSGSARGSTRLDGLVPGFEEEVELAAELSPYVDSRGRVRERILALYRRPGSHWKEAP